VPSGALPPRAPAGADPLTPFRELSP